MPTKVGQHEGDSVPFQDGDWWGDVGGSRIRSNGQILYLLRRPCGPYSGCLLGLLV